MRSRPVISGGGMSGSLANSSRFVLQELVVVEHAVAARAIDAVQLHLVVEMRARHEALQLRDAHLLHVLEDHVIGDRLDRGVDLRAREAQPRHELLGHLGAEFVVAAEADAAVGIDREGAGLADIVEEHGEDERHGDLRGEQAEHDARVHEDVALGMKLRRLLAAFERFESRAGPRACSPLSSSRSKPRTRCGERKIFTNSSRMRSALTS